MIKESLHMLSVMNTINIELVRNPYKVVNKVVGMVDKRFAI